MRRGYYRCTGTYIGESNFIVWENPVGGYGDLLFNEIDSYSGEALFELDRDSSVVLEVTGQGSWNLVFVRIT